MVVEDKNGLADGEEDFDGDARGIYSNAGPDDQLRLNSWTGQRTSRGSRVLSQPSGSGLSEDKGYGDGRVQIPAGALSQALRDGRRALRVDSAHWARECVQWDLGTPGEKGVEGGQRPAKALAEEAAGQG